MLKPYEDNYTLLSKLYKKEQNILMLARLKNTKSIVNTNCPNCFNSLKKKRNKIQEKKDLSN